MLYEVNLNIILELNIFSDFYHIIVSVKLKLNTPHLNCLVA